MPKDTKYLSVRDFVKEAMHNKTAYGGNHEFDTKAKINGPAANLQPRTDQGFHLQTSFLITSRHVAENLFGGSPPHHW